MSRSRFVSSLWRKGSREYSRTRERRKANGASERVAERKKNAEEEGEEMDKKDEEKEVAEKKEEQGRNSRDDAVIKYRLDRLTWRNG